MSAKKYPVVTTVDYDVTRKYYEGDPIYLVAGRFTNSAPADKDQMVFGVFKKIDEDLMFILVTSETWDNSQYKKYCLLKVMQEKIESTINPKVILVDPTVLADIQRLCVYEFMPETRADSSSAGMLYGLVVYETAGLPGSGILVY